MQRGKKLATLPHNAIAHGGASLARSSQTLVFIMGLDWTFQNNSSTFYYFSSHFCLPFHISLLAVQPKGFLVRALWQWEDHIPLWRFIDHPGKNLSLSSHLHFFKLGMLLGVVLSHRQSLITTLTLANWFLPCSRQWFVVPPTCSLRGILSPFSTLSDSVHCIDT